MDSFSFDEKLLTEFCTEFIKTEQELDGFNLDGNIEFIETTNADFFNKDNANPHSKINKVELQSELNPLEADLMDLNSIKREPDENKSEEAAMTIDSSTEIEISEEIKTEPIHSFSEMDTHSSDEFEEQATKRWVCEFCSKVLANNFCLGRHRLVHTGEKPYQCRYCSKTFTSKNYQQTHERVHLGHKPFKCSHCSYQSSHRSSVNRHIKSMSCNQTKSVDQNHHHTHSSEKPFHCSFCPATFSHNSHCVKHERYHTGERPFECPNCWFRSHDKYTIKRHLKRNGCTNYLARDKSNQVIGDLNDSNASENGEKKEEEKNGAEREVIESPTTPSQRNGEHMKKNTQEVQVKLFTCKFCRKTFDTASDLKNHLQTHPSAKPFQCSFCPATFSRNSYLVKHERYHTGERPFECPKCWFRSHDKFTITRHLKRNGCTKYLARDESNQVIGDSIDSTAFENGEKNEEEVEKRDITKTAEKKSTQKVQEARFACKFCIKTFDTVPDLENHRQTHPRGKPYQCTYCSATFSRKFNREKHERTHTGEKPFGCPKCSFRSSYKYTIRQHLEKNTCTMERSFLRINKLYRIIGDSSDSAAFQSEEKKEEAQKDIIEFSTISSTLSTKYECQFCVQTFDTAVDLENHHHTHSSKKPFHCSFCPATFLYNSHCVKHERYHTGERPFECPKCWFRAHDKSSIKRHLKRNRCTNYVARDKSNQVIGNSIDSTALQNGEKNGKKNVTESPAIPIQLCSKFKCMCCDQRFDTIRGLKTHQKTHIIEKPYKCSYCPAKFSHNPYRLKHERRFHIGDKPFKCPKCPYRATIRGAVTRHMLNWCDYVAPRAKTVTETFGCQGDSIGSSAPNNLMVIEGGERMEEDEDASFIIVQNQEIDAIDPLLPSNEDKPHIKIEEHQRESTLIDNEASIRR